MYIKITHSLLFTFFSFINFFNRFKALSLSCVELFFFWGKQLQAKTFKKKPGPKLDTTIIKRIKVCCDHDINSPPKKNLLQKKICSNWLFFCIILLLLLLLFDLLALIGSAFRKRDLTHKKKLNKTDTHMNVVGIWRRRRNK